MDRPQAMAALRATGQLLQRSGQTEAVTVILGGAVAAMTVATDS